MYNKPKIVHFRTNIQFKIHSKPPNSVQHHHLQCCFTHDGKTNTQQKYLTVA